MLSRINCIENVGIFKDYNPDDPPQFKKLTLIYGENGSGKSTLSEILYSLNTNNPDIITSKKTLGKGEDCTQSILLKINGSNYEFSNCEWNNKFGNIEIFDSRFIERNVYSGFDITSDQRKNFGKVLLGEDAIIHQKRLDKLGEEKKENTDRLNHLENELGESLIQENILSSDIDLEIDNKISSISTQINEAEQSESISSKTEFLMLSLIDVSTIEKLSILKKSIDDIEEAAVEKVETHIKERLGTEGESWLKKGTSFLRNNDICPFCAQKLSQDSIKLIKAYSAFFSESYIGFQEVITESKNLVLSTFEKAKLNTVSVIEKNKGLLEFWEQYVDTEKLKNSNCSELMVELFDRLIKNCELLFENKEKKPLQEIKKDIIESIIQSVSKRIEAENTLIEEINQKIYSKKRRISNYDIEVLKKAKRIFELKKLRHFAKKKECNDYIKNNGESKRIAEEIKREKNDLKIKSEEILNNYCEGVNEYLRSFGAGFEISDVKGDTATKEVSVDYSICINDVQVSVKSKKKDCPHFGNILSDGDKRSLALAFFFARLDKIDDLDKKIIVFDDPFSSLDKNRERYTVDHIVNKLKLCKQGIVMSHNLLFLRFILQRRDINLNTTSVSVCEGECYEFDIYKNLLSSLISEKILRLRECINNPRFDIVILKDAIANLRDILEWHFKATYPRLIKDDATLGDISTKLAEVQNGNDLHSPLYIECSNIEDIRIINRYSNTRGKHVNGLESYDPLPSKQEFTTIASRVLEVYFPTL